MKRKIAVVTGSRAEYDILYSTIDEIDKSSSLDLKIIVTGAHLSEKFGNTCKEIENDCFKIDRKVECLLPDDTLAGRAKSVGIEITGLAEAFEEIQPDIVLVAGDREEVISGAIAASYQNIPVAHMCGGDTAYGSIDNAVRDATTKLSHIHFPMTKSHAKRIIKMGEEPYRVHVVGHGGLDRIISTPKTSKKQLSEYLNFDIESGPVLLMIQHVLSSEYQEAFSQIEITLNALSELGYKVLIGYPNSDVGSMDIVNTIEKYRDKIPCLIYKNLPRKIFVNLLRNVDILIGNSSCGILEAPLLKLPVVNIGNRQRNREISSNVLFVDHEKNCIKKTIKKMLFDEEYKKKIHKCESIYGDGHTGKKTAKILSQFKLDLNLLNKPNL